MNWSPVTASVIPGLQPERPALHSAGEAPTLPVPGPPIQPPADQLHLALPVVAWSTPRSPRETILFPQFRQRGPQQHGLLAPLLLRKLMPAVKRLLIFSLCSSQRFLVRKPANKIKPRMEQSWGNRNAYHVTGDLRFRPLAFVLIFTVRCMRRRSVQDNRV